MLLQVVIRHRARKHMEQQPLKEDWAQERINRIAAVLALAHEAVEQFVALAKDGKELRKRAKDFTQLGKFEELLKQGHTNALGLLDEAVAFFEYFAQHDDALKNTLENRKSPVFLEMRVLHDILNSPQNILQKLPSLLEEAEKIQNSRLKEDVKHRIAGMIKLEHMQRKYVEIEQDALSWQTRMAINRDLYPFAQRLRGFLGIASAFGDAAFVQQLGKDPRIRTLDDLNNESIRSIPQQMQKIEAALIDIGKDYQMGGNYGTVTQSNPMWKYVNGAKMTGVPLVAYLGRELIGKKWEDDVVTGRFLKAAKTFANEFRQEYNNGQLAERILKKIKELGEQPDKIMMYLANEHDALEARHQGIMWNGSRMVAEAGNGLVFAFSGRTKQIDMEIGKEAQGLQQSVQKELYGVSGEEFLKLLERAIAKAWKLRRKVLQKKKKALEEKAAKLALYIDTILRAISMEEEAEWLARVSQALKENVGKTEGIYAQPNPPANILPLVTLAADVIMKSKAKGGVAALAQRRQQKSAYAISALRTLDEPLKSLFLEYYALFGQMSQLVRFDGKERQANKIVGEFVGGISPPNNSQVSSSPPQLSEKLREVA